MKRSKPCHKLLQSILKLIVLLGGIYGSGISGLLLLRKPITEANKHVGMFNAFAHLLILPSIALLPLSLLLRNPRAALMNLIPFITFVQSYGRLFLPKPDMMPVSTIRQLKVLTFNLHKESNHLEPMVSILRTCDADIIAVQELSHEAAEHFKTMLIDRYPYMALHGNHTPSSGQGVLSRFPITNEYYWQNPHIASKTLGHLRVELEVTDKTIIVYNAHPIHPGMSDSSFNTRPRGAEIDVVLNLARRDTHPILIMGDFNMTDQSEDYQRITTQFEDCFRAVGYGMGFSFPDLSSFITMPRYWPLPIRLFPFLRLDYIFYSKHFHPLYAHVWPTSGGSDHRPVYAILSLKDDAV